MRGLAIVLALAACSRNTPPPAVATEATVRAPARSLVIPKTTDQLVIALVDDWSSIHARIGLWQRPAGGDRRAWRKLDEWPAMIGRAGSAWGAGLHGTGAPDRRGPSKREGDGKSPAGVFALRASYGYADDAPKGWRMPYESSFDLECIDDPASDHYAQIVDRKQVPSDWLSAELLRRDDELYTWVITVGHNAEAKPGLGSCIFLHVWNGPESTTAGCTAMRQAKLEALLQRLDPAAQPLFVLLPRDEYRAVADAWGLPEQ